MISFLSFWEEKRAKLELVVLHEKVSALLLMMLALSKENCPGAYLYSPSCYFHACFVKYKEALTLIHTFLQAAALISS